MELRYKTYFPAAGRFLLHKHPDVRISKNLWASNHGQSKKMRGRVYENVLRLLLKNQSPPHMCASAVSKANMTFSMETEKRTQSVYGAAASSSCWYINTSSRGWSIASYIYILFFVTPKRTLFPSMEIKTRGTTVLVALPSFRSFHYKTFFQKFNPEPHMQLQILATLKQADDILMETKNRCTQGDAAPARVPIQLNYKADQKDAMSAFAPTLQNSLSENGHKTFHGSLKTQKV